MQPRLRLRSGGFDMGAGAVRLPAIGPASQFGPISPMEQPPVRVSHGKAAEYQARGAVRFGVPSPAMIIV
jgi:hypothetical protein